VRGCAETFPSALISCSNLDPLVVGRLARDRQHYGSSGWSCPNPLLDGRVRRRSGCQSPQAGERFDDLFLASLVLEASQCQSLAELAMEAPPEAATQGGT